MSKLKEEELLKKLRNWCMSLDKAWPSFQLDWTKRDQQAYKQIVELIKKPEVTEEWYKEKAKIFVGKIIYIPTNMDMQEYNIKVDIAKVFIRSLVEEIGK